MSFSSCIAGYKDSRGGGGLAAACEAVEQESGEAVEQKDGEVAEQKGGEALEHKMVRHWSIRW